MELYGSVVESEIRAHGTAQDKVQPLDDQSSYHLQSWQGGFHNDTR